MDKFIVEGGAKLAGSVIVSTAKNSALKLLAASLLVPGPVRLNRLAKLKDISTMLNLLEKLGVQVESGGGEETIINASEVKETVAHYEIVKTMRASILVLGPLLSRFGKASVSLPGGCAIGARPIDLHLMGLKLMGAEITVHAGYVEAKAQRLKGAKIFLPFPSVGATENILMAAVYATGETIINGAAQEPEIADLGNFLLAIFPKLEIEGLGTSEITIRGIERNSPYNRDVLYTPIGDRIEAATLMMAAIMSTEKGVVVEGFDPQHIGEILRVVKKMGANINILHRGVEISKTSTLYATNVETAPYPGFPTDAQAQLVALCLMAQGESVISENIFENRFMHVPELCRMNADLQIDGKSVRVRGNKKLMGAPVMCTDLRASAALVMASLVAEGTSEISRVYHLDRGYEALESKLRSLGANIVRMKE